MKDIEHPLQSLKNTLPFSSKDWGQEKRDAWIYGVICGWDDDCFNEFNKKFGWDDKTWQRLKRLNHKFKQLESLEERLFEQKEVKTAERMFLEAGFTLNALETDKSNIQYDYIHEREITMSIIFCVDEKVYDIDTSKNHAIEIDFETNKAINKQIEELGW